MAKNKSPLQDDDFHEFDDVDEYGDDEPSPSSQRGKKRGKYDKTKRKGATEDPIALAHFLIDAVGDDAKNQTLIQPETYPPDPDRPSQHKLYEMIRISPTLYHRMIGWIASRATPTVAAELNGIRPWTFQSWMSRGYADIHLGADTYYSRLVYDVRRAICHARIHAELEVTQSDPLFFLQRGSAKMLGDDWNAPSKQSDSDSTDTFLPSQQGQFEELEDGTVVPRLANNTKDEEDIEEGEFAVVSINPENFKESLRILSEVNVHNIEIDDDDPDIEIYENIIPEEHRPSDADIHKHSTGDE